jgi:hypothetical protein
MMRTLLLESRIFGVTIYGDGATITNTPLINILVASPNNPSVLLEIVDCTSQMAIGGKKDATYLASVVRPYITAIDAHGNTRHQKHQAVVDLFQYNGANNVQLSSRILARHHPRITICHGAEHAISLFFNDVFDLVKISLFFCIPSSFCSHTQFPIPNYRLKNTRIYLTSARVAESYLDLYATDPTPCSNIT